MHNIWRRTLSLAICLCASLHFALYAQVPQDHALFTTMPVGTIPAVTSYSGGVPVFGKAPASAFVNLIQLGIVTPEGMLNPAKDDDITDDTISLQECMNWSSLNHVTCDLDGKMPYLFRSSLVIPTALTLKGHGFVNGTELDSQVNGPGFILGAGPIQGVTLENFNLKMNHALPNSLGFYLSGVPDAAFGGAGYLSDAVFRDIQVDDPALQCMYLHGGGGFSYNYLDPNQFLDFYHFNCNTYQPASSHPSSLMKIDGQTAQTNFYGGQLNGHSQTDRNPIGWEVVQRTQGLNDGPGAINWYGYTTQNVVKGIYSTEANNLHYGYGYMENVSTGWDAAFSLNITFDYNTMNNVGTVFGLMYAENGVTGHANFNYVQTSGTPAVAYATCANQNDFTTEGNGTNQLGYLGTVGCTTVQLNQDNYDGTYRDTINDPGNKFNQQAATAGMAVNESTGALVAQTGYSASALIRAQPNTNYIASSATNGLGSTYGFAFYDINGVYLAGVSGVAAGHTFESPNNDSIRYVRYGMPTADLATEMFMQSQTLSSTYTPFGGGVLFMPSHQIYLQGDGGTNPIYEIISAQNSGNTVEIIANGSPLYLGTPPSTVSSSLQNISYGTFATPLIVPAGTSVTLRRYDLGQSWAVESVNGSLPNGVMSVADGTGFPNLWGAFTSANANATLPNVPGSTGIPGGEFCTYNLKYAGAAGVYADTADCNNQGVHEVYRAQALLGQEVWTKTLSIDNSGNVNLEAGANLTLATGAGGSGGNVIFQNGLFHSIQPQETGLPTIGTACTSPGELIPATTGHGVVCQGGSWATWY